MTSQFIDFSESYFSQNTNFIFSKNNEQHTMLINDWYEQAMAIKMCISDLLMEIPKKCPLKILPTSVLKLHFPWLLPANNQEWQGGWAGQFLGDMGLLWWAILTSELLTALANFYTNCMVVKDSPTQSCFLLSLLHSRSDVHPDVHHDLILIFSEKHFP